MLQGDSHLESTTLSHCTEDGLPWAGWKQGDGYKANTVTWVRKNEDMDQDDSTVQGEKWLNS